MRKDKPIADIVERIHKDCSELVRETVGRYLPVAGNVAIFCQSDKEHQQLLELSGNLTLPSDNPNQKYFKLRRSIVIPEINGVPESSYDYLYIRKPSPNSTEIGDIDFILSPSEYTELKKKVRVGKIRNAYIYDRPGWDMVEIRKPGVMVLPYVTTKDMAEKARVRF